MLKSVRSVVQLRKFEFNGDKRRLAACGDLKDLRKLAKRNLPGGVFDYFDGAAEDEWSLANNSSAYSKFGLVPKDLRDVSQIDTATTIMGQPVPFPIALSPTGFTRIAHPQGELAVARVAGKNSLPFTLSTLGTRSIEEVASVATGPLWYQLYVWRDRGLSRELVQRAKAAGYKAIMVTVDTAVFGRRERDVRRGFTLPPKIGLETFIDGIRHPRWTFKFVTNEPITFSAVAGRSDVDGSKAITLSDYVNSQFDPTLSWHDLDWIRQESGLPIMLKGIQCLADAKQAASMGVDAIALSNHGGRQLDQGESTIKSTAALAREFKGRTKIMMDGGIRSGSDIAVALASGAEFTFLGRAPMYGVCALGAKGGDQVIE
ncbi:MAG: alpha-hydroxy acid oxidase, partial [Acidimicrobiaceae bacterium]